MYDIDIANEQSFLEVDEECLRDVVRLMLSEEQVVKARISLALVDNSTIRELNARHLRHDHETDVLSFLLECSPRDSQHKLRGFGKRIDGEVIVSTEKAVESAGAFGWSPLEEAMLYTVHGVLHLLGYDDTTDAERRIMRGRERAILKHWGLVPVYDEMQPANLPLRGNTRENDDVSGVDG